MIDIFDFPKSLLADNTGPMNHAVQIAKALSALDRGPAACSQIIHACVQIQNFATKISISVIFRILSVIGSSTG